MDTGLHRRLWRNAVSPRAEAGEVRITSPVLAAYAQRAVPSTQGRRVVREAAPTTDQWMQFAEAVVRRWFSMRQLFSSLSVILFGRVDDCRHLCVTDVSVDLRRGELARVDRAWGLAVRCERGSVWITQDGDLRDVILRTGETWALNGDVTVLVSAINSATVRLQLAKQHDKAST